MSEEDAARVVGQGAADKDGRGNINVGDGGVTFLLASTGALPGGSELVRSYTLPNPSDTFILEAILGAFLSLLLPTLLLLLLIPTHELHSAT